MATFQATAANQIATPTNVTFGNVTPNGSFPGPVADLFDTNGNINLTIDGAGGNDQIVGYTTGTSIDGGDGIDTLAFSAPGDAANLTGAADNKIVNVEIIDASAATAALTGGNALNLSAQI
jgi:phospholipase/lecithinase/hemolysin